MAAPLTLIVTGPTASGKSAYALELAEQLNGAIINADSMQVYRDLPILTAQPQAEERVRVPHRLYGTLDAAIRGTAADWAQEAQAEIDALTTAGKIPILVGGTGFYLKTLLAGIAYIPPTPPELLADVQARMASIGAAALWQELQDIDAAAAARIDAHDRQRIVRAISVWKASGRTLSEWQKAGSLAPEGHNRRFFMLVLLPERAALYQAINARFSEMIEKGALDEVARFEKRRLDDSLPAMRAHGVPELIAHIRGEISLDHAIQHSQQVTRNYAKRQTSWIKNQWLGSESEAVLVAPPLLLDPKDDQNSQIKTIAAIKSHFAKD